MNKIREELRGIYKSLKDLSNKSSQCNITPDLHHNPPSLYEFEHNAQTPSLTSTNARHLYHSTDFSNHPNVWYDPFNTHNHGSYTTSCTPNKDPVTYSKLNIKPVSNGYIISTINSPTTIEVVAFDKKELVDIIDELLAMSRFEQNVIDNL